MGKRITLIYDVEENVSDEEAVNIVRDNVEEVLHWYVQDLPGLGQGRWIES